MSSRQLKYFIQIHDCTQHDNPHRWRDKYSYTNEKAAIADFKKVKKQVEVDRITKWRLIFRAETVLDATKKRKKR